jgi:hypothetical protein
MIEALVITLSCFGVSLLFVGCSYLWSLLDTKMTEIILAVTWILGTLLTLRLDAMENGWIGHDFFDFVVALLFWPCVAVYLLVRKIRRI